MTSIFKPVLLAGLLATAALSSLAQPGPGPGPSDERRAQMQERREGYMAKRQADLKAKLKLTPAQESGWNAYLAAMKPPAGVKRPNRAEMDKLSTPERLDKMRELRKERDAEMDKRIEATKAFYASLTPEQQKVFDTDTRRHAPRFEGRGPRTE